ncbi:TPA: restriction endonuclease subunit S [Streptococcus suis]
MSRPMKDSGIEWAGEIPIDWNVVPFKSLLKKQKNILEKWQGEDVLSLTMNGVIVRDLVNPTGKMPSTFDGYQIIDKDSLILCLFDIDVTPRCVGIAYNNGVTSSAYSHYKVKKGNVRYLYYLLLMLDNDKILLSYSKTLRSTITDEYFGAVRVPITQDITEQVKIAAYLDNQVATIDAIIADTKESIQALKDYKQAIITETVTKGLDPQAPMKDSGIEWIGQVPEGWEVRKNKYIYDFSKGLSITKADLTETGIPVINYGQIHSKYPVFFTPGRDDLPFVPSTFSSDTKSKLNFGDFVFADTSEDYLGSGNFSMHNSEIEAMAGYHTIVLKVNKLVEYFEPKYLAYYFAGDVHRNQIRRKISGVKVFTISQTILKNTYCLIPPLDTQTQIVAYLDQKIGQIDQLVADKEALIAEYEAYKKSLIYEVVTGKRRVD